MVHPLTLSLTRCRVSALRRACGLLTAAALGGCVPVPYFPFATSQITEETLAGIKPETSTRIDVLLTLSDPSVRGDEDRYFIYNWQQEHGGLVFFMGGMGGAAPVAAVGSESCNSLVIRFADDGRVAGVRQFKGRPKTSGATVFSGGESKLLSGTCGNVEVANEIDAWLKEVAP